MALACAGYRLDSKATGHHKTAFLALPLALGATARPLANFFDMSRRKRNEIDYDRAFVASDADAAEIVQRVQELETLIETWISTQHAALAK
jgi:hypothetical protein